MGGGGGLEESRLVFKAHRLVYHSTLGLRVIIKKKKKERRHRAGSCASLALARYMREDVGV